MYVLIVGAGKVGWNLAGAHQQGPRGHRDRVRPGALRRRGAGARAQRAVRGRLGALGARARRDRARRPRGGRYRRRRDILISQVAREKYGIARVVARCNNPRNLPHFRLLGVKPVISATDLILRLIEHEVPKYGLVHLLDLPEERLEIIELEWPRAPRRRAPGQGARAARRLARDLRAARRAGLRAVRRLDRAGRRRRSSWCSTSGSRRA